MDSCTTVEGYIKFIEDNSRKIQFGVILKHVDGWFGRLLYFDNKIYEVRSWDGEMFIFDDLDDFDISIPYLEIGDKNSTTYELSYNSYDIICSNSLDVVKKCRFSATLNKLKCRASVGDNVKLVNLTVDDCGSNGKILDSINFTYNDTNKKRKLYIIKIGKCELTFKRTDFMLIDKEDIYLTANLICNVCKNESSYVKRD
jgi:hypothetical protein